MKMELSIRKTSSCCGLTSRTQAVRAFHAWRPPIWMTTAQSTLTILPCWSRYSAKAQSRRPRFPRMRAWVATSSISLSQHCRRAGLEAQWRFIFSILASTRRTQLPASSRDQPRSSASTALSWCRLQRARPRELSSPFLWSWPINKSICIRSGLRPEPKSNVPEIAASDTARQLPISSLTAMCRRILTKRHIQKGAAMPHYGILRDHKFEGVDDLRGADVYGVNDEKLGSIDDVIFDHSSGDIRYIVLKTGGLLSRKKVMVPANRVEPYGNHDDKFYAELDKERLEMLPEFKEETMKAQSDWSTYEKDYEKRWNDGAVMYNQSSGRIITPPPEDVVSGPMSSGHASVASGRRLDLKPEKIGRASCRER